MPESCLFCKIASGHVPATIVVQDDDVVAFRDINPQAPTHVLVIPRRHIALLNDLTPQDGPIVAKLVQTAAEVARREGVDERGYRLVMNCNREAGQSVFHIHVHLLGGRAMA
ncbi:MAG: histidine triad nucleotide-binding protein, partial [Planctomycetes bacterium]|nr:histidine triad nucleotide-binding protein [Planctomycetota bacterium]